MSKSDIRVECVPVFRVYKGGFCDYEFRSAWHVWSGKWANGGHRAGVAHFDCHLRPATGPHCCSVPGTWYLVCVLTSHAFFPFQMSIKKYQVADIKKRTRTPSKLYIAFLAPPVNPCRRVPSARHMQGPVRGAAAHASPSGRQAGGFFHRRWRRSWQGKNPLRRLSTRSCADWRTAVSWF